MVTPAEARQAMACQGKPDAKGSGEPEKAAQPTRTAIEAARVRWSQVHTQSVEANGADGRAGV